ncbi:hypothetical protein AYO48_04895 [Gaiella sp. SCGC AG-212-M14]|nr:hypothetical protein AYO48_04895 [Gaiella sp. SCGC AG-212-M14]
MIAFPLGFVVESTMFAGTVMIGGVLSTTVTVTVNDADEELPAASVAEQMTGVAPEPKSEPEEGKQSTETAPSTRSVADGAGQLTATGGEPVETD